MSTLNLYRALRELLPEAPLQVATVIDVQISQGTSTVEWPGGSQQRVRGAIVAAGGHVFVRDGVIEGTAPGLALEVIEV
nr:hypothetical protein [Rhodoferax sp.]